MPTSSTPPRPACVHGPAARRATPLRAWAAGLGAAVLALAAGLAAPLPARAAEPAAAPRSGSSAAPQKVLRYAFRIAETSLDPTPISDLYSRILVAHIFEAPLKYAFLARPIQVKPNTLEALPEVSADFRTYTLRLKKGIYFDDDPAFKGQRRELVAADYAYSIKRHFDPRWKSGNLYILENAKILGLNELRREVLDKKIPFPYDREVEGLKVLDRHTLQIRFAEPQPRFSYTLADHSFTGAVAREVVEFYGDKIGEHPVGTGPFRLVRSEWVRSSRIVFERSPTYRGEIYDEQAPEGDAMAQAAARALKGRRMPMVDRVEISIVEENQPRWLAFLNDDHDILWEVPPEFIQIAMPNNRLAPNLERRGMRALRYTRTEIAYSYFAMENPVVGGYTPEKVALRRAISLAVDVDEEIRLVRRNQAVPAQSAVAPGGWGYDPDFRSEMGQFNRARARALLDLYGWVDRNGDGWREQPDGSPLQIEYATQPDQSSRQLVEQWKKNMDAIGIRMVFKTAQWPENLKASRAGKLMMWGAGWNATEPDSDTFLAIGYGPNKGQANHARFDLPAFNRLYERQTVLSNTPERRALIDDAKKLLIAYMPYKVHVHRLYTDLAQPWVIGYHRNPFVRDFWGYIDIDGEAQQRVLRH